MNCLMNYRALIALRWIPALVLLLAPSAQGSLGGDQDTILSDRSSFATPMYVKRSLRSYDLHEMGNEAIRVREYATSGGAVFAICWAGTNLPDLRPLFGFLLRRFSIPELDGRFQRPQELSRPNALAGLLRRGGGKTRGRRCGGGRRLSLERGGRQHAGGAGRRASVAAIFYLGSPRRVKVLTRVTAALGLYGLSRGKSSSSTGSYRVLGSFWPLEGLARARRLDRQS